MPRRKRMSEADRWPSACSLTLINLLAFILRFQPDLFKCSVSVGFVFFLSPPRYKTEIPEFIAMKSDSVLDVKLSFFRLNWLVRDCLRMQLSSISFVLINGKMCQSIITKFGWKCFHCPRKSPQCLALIEWLKRISLYGKKDDILLKPWI